MRPSISYSCLLFTVLVILIHHATATEGESHTRPPHIAIIGSGIAGSSCAYYLRQRLPNAVITVYERDAHVGGRMHSVRVPGVAEPIEVGGSIVLDLNKRVRDLGLALGLNFFDPFKMAGPRRRFAVWSGDKFAFKESKHVWQTLVRMVWRYGTAPLKSRDLIKEMVEQFTANYFFFEGNVFETSEELLRAVKADTVADDTLAELVGRWGLNPRYVAEFVAGVIRWNYAQNLSINAFAGQVGMAGSGGALYSVVGGNHQMAEGALAASRARVLLNHTVSQINVTAGPCGATSGSASTSSQQFPYTVTSVRNGRGGQRTASRGADAVVIAAPLHSAGLRICGLGRRTAPPSASAAAALPLVTAPSDPHDPAQRVHSSADTHQNDATSCTCRQWQSGVSKNAADEDGAAEETGEEKEWSPEYERVHVTLVVGLLDPSYFGEPDAWTRPFYDFPAAVVTMDNPAIPFLSAALLRTIDEPRRNVYGGRHVYKLFSKRELDDAALGQIMAYQTWVYRHVWDAYPVLMPVAHPWMPLRLDPAELVFHTNAMEQVVSTMETEAIASFNIALWLARALDPDSHLNASSPDSNANLTDDF